jgi:enterobactin synthetase component F
MTAMRPLLADVDLDRSHRLTGAEAGLWYAQRLDPHSPAYLTAEVVELTGPLDEARLDQAIATAVAEADTLHRRFVEVDGPDGVEPRWVPSLASAAVVHHDLRDVPDPDAAARALMDEHLARPVDLADGPLHAEVVVRVADDRWLWFQQVHHLAADGYGVNLLLRRVAAVYVALGRGGPAGRPFGPLLAVLDEEQALLDGDGPALAVAHWRHRLAGLDSPPVLTDRPALPQRSSHRARARLDAPTVHDIVAASAAEEVGWTDVVAAVVAAYLARATGTDDVVLGLPVMNRMGSRSARVPAMVMNVVPLRVGVPDDATLAEVAAGVATTFGEDRVHHRHRAEELRRQLGRLGDGRRLVGPVVNVLPFTGDLDLGDVAADVDNLAAGPVEDLILTVRARSDGGVALELDANPASYDATSTAQHLARLVHLLEGVARDGLGRSVAELDLLSPDERALVVEGFNATGHPVADVTLTELLVAGMGRHSGREALRFAGRSLTYAELDERSAALARRLVESGAEVGNLVAVGVPRSLELVVSLVAVLRAGCAYLPLDLGYPEDRLRGMLEDAAPRCAVGDASVLGPLVGAGTVLVAPNESGATDVALPDPAASGGDGPAYVIYTSGSTGRPKGVVVPHRGIVNRLEWMQGAYDLGRDDRVLQKTPAGFDVSVWEFFWPLMVGATLVVAVPGGHQDPAYLARTIVEEGVTTAHFVPSMLRLFVDEPLATGAGASLRRLICSGEALPADLARDVHDRIGVELHNLYGPTEASVDVTAWRFDPDTDRVTVPIGRPVWNTRLYVLDDRDRPVPIGVTGHLHLAGVQLATGYLGRPELTAERFVPDPFAPGERMYRTGDLARWRHDGVVEFLGRSDHQVKLRGLRIELGEIEAALEDLPGVSAAAVGVHQAGGEPSIVAWLVATDVGSGGGGSTDGALDPVVVRTALRRTLPDYMVPSHVLTVPGLPLTPNGKLDRAALPAPDAASVGERVVAAPASPSEEVVCRLVGEVLGRDVVGADDDFFDLGGSSLTAVTLARRLGAAFGRDVPVGAVFDDPTPRGIASRADAGAEGSSLAVVLPLRHRPGSAPLWCVHPAGGLSWCYAGLLRWLPPDVGVMGLQARGLDPADPTPPATSIAAMAADYASTIRAHQAEGPYRLLGWSVGGVVAHEVATLLEAAGEDVELLVLLDAYPSEQWRDRPPPTEQEALQALLHIAGHDPARDGEAAELDADGVIDLLRRDGSALANLDRTTVAAMVDTVRRATVAMRGHEHGRFGGDVVFFTATAPRAELWIDREGWRDHVDGELRNHDLDCTHPEMVRADRLREIAAVLAPLLAGGAAEASAGPPGRG